MPVPDLSGLTRQELAIVMQDANARYSALEHSASQVESVLSDPTAVRTVIATLNTQITAVQTVLNTPNATIKADPQTYINVLAKALKRSLNADIRALKLSGRVFDDASVGDEG